MPSMKRSKKDVKNAEVGIDSEEPEFPWGLRVDLDNESLDKLGIKDLPKVGEKMTLVAKVEVIRVSESDSVSGEPRRDMELQITDMELAPEDTRSPGEIFYGDN